MKDNMVEVEIAKNEFLIMESEKAIELAITEYYKGNQVNINNKKFDIFNFGDFDYRSKLQLN